jgi:acyl carrier protein
MSIRARVISEIAQIRQGSEKHFPPLTDDLVLLESGLDSLGIAILVTRLEDALGVDPFNEPEVTRPPVTLGDFIRLYENAVPTY